jgi:hypothetical protein
MPTQTPTPVPLPSILPGAPRPTSPLPQAALDALSRLESALSPADVAAHEAASYVRPSRRSEGGVR